jgi:DNA mismatch endonuclease (patch repair protein)
MSDVLTSAQRRRCMASVGAKDTKPELTVRRLVHSLGFRYRLHVPDLPGRPDLVFSGRHKVVFVHGCFWHRHNCARGRSVPSIRANFWMDKLEANRRRDAKNRRRLIRLGWKVLTVWECQTKRPEWLLPRLVDFLEG